MGLFDRWKTDPTIDSKTGLPKDPLQCALLLCRMNAIEGYESLLELAGTNSDAAMQVALDYELNDCKYDAAIWYKNAYYLLQSERYNGKAKSAQIASYYQSQTKKAEEGYKRCYNPYHLIRDFNFVYRPNRGRGGMPRDPSPDEDNKLIKQKQLNDFLSAVTALEGNISKDEIQDKVRTIYLIASAQGGLPAAMQWMGDFCENVEKNLEKAADWYKKAADNDDVNGARCYADMLMTGNGVQKDIEEAAKYYQKAADEGNVESMFVLGQYYSAKGETEKGYEYFQKAADKGYAPAAQMIKKSEPESNFEDIEDKLKCKFIELAEIKGFFDEGEVEYIEDIFQPDDFCSKAFDYCSKQYAGMGAEKLSFEYCMTAFYGCICATALWDRDRDGFDTESVWDSLYQQINVEFTDANAERLLGTKQGEDKAEFIFAMISEYIRFAHKVVIPNINNKEIALIAMKYAYRLGMLTAIDELELDDYTAIAENLSDDEDDEAEPGEIKSVPQFYADCVKAFHDEAEKYGVATRGVIFIPELMRYGENAAVAFLNDSFFQRQSNGDVVLYYYMIMSLCIDAGIVFAAKWHENYAGLRDYYERIISEGPADDANELLEKHFPKSISDNQGNPFFNKIYPVWMVKHSPYWDLEDPRQYTLKAMVASYQLGVSMMLEKLGY